jgi:S1-C subfamily serine protease
VRALPDRSFAAIQTASGGSLIAPSMTLEGFTVAAIEPDGLVLHDAHGNACDPDEPASEPEPRAPPVEVRHDDLVTELAPGRYRIARSAIDAGEHLRVRAIPDANGVRIYGVRASSIAERAGLRNGDRIVAVDGQPITSSDAALAAYARALEGQPLGVTIERAGGTLEIVYQLAP